MDTYLDSNRDRDMEKIYESEVYIEAQNFVKKFDTKTVAELKNFIDMMLMSKEVFTYEIDWEVVHKVRSLFYLPCSCFSSSSHVCILLSLILLHLSCSSNCVLVYLHAVCAA